ncbi:MAG: carboxypeptidase regulatory-like domain-containing protein [Myxococcaceae bacterium]|nr:carboxypeptidase regulatory-like domain-containing protein [Myxococcaceae bacterium]
MVPLLVALAAGCGPGIEGFGDDAIDAQSEALCASGATLNGIDVSYWQQSINWASVKGAGKVYAITRAGHGTATDTYFARNWSGMKANGIIRGAYHYLVPNQSISTQANMMIQAMATLGPDDLPPMLDVEEVDGVSPAGMAAAVGQWLSAVKAATGRTPMIYTGSYFWNDYVKSSAFTSSALVLPNYSSSCPTPPTAWNKWTIHQHSSTGSVAGISGNVDLDRFNGDLPALKAFIASGETGPVTPPGTGTVTGAIYEGTTTTNRVAGAVVSVGGQTQTTAADGMYKFDLAPGTYTVTATKAGYATNSVSRTVTSGQTIWGSMGLTVATTSSTGTLAGLVYAFNVEHAADMSAVLSGVLVSAGGKSATTDAAGKFSLTLAPGTYTLTATKAGFAMASSTRTVTDGATTTAQIGLTPAGGSDVKPPDLAITFPADGTSQDVAQLTLTGTASDDTGAVASLKLSVNALPGTDVPVTAGKFAVDLKLRPGTNVLLLTGKDAAGNQRQVTHTVTFRAGVSGTVRRDGSQVKIPGSTVDLLDSNGAPVTQFRSATGDFALDVAQVPGEFVLVGSAPGFITSRQPIHLGDDARLTFDLTLVQGVEGDGAPMVRFVNLHDGDEVDADHLKVEAEVSGMDLAGGAINGVPASLYAGTQLTATVALAPGDNTLTATVIDGQGHTATATVTVHRPGTAKAPGGCSTAAGLDLTALLALTLLRRRARR